jgi:hypothetical protein
MTDLPEAKVDRSEIHLARIGLYYPYIHFRDEDWLKVAALYWPRIARVVPRDYPVRDSDVVRSLQDELDFVVRVDPSSATQTAANTFRNVMNYLGFWRDTPDHYETEFARTHVPEPPEVAPPRWFVPRGWPEKPLPRMGFLDRDPWAEEAETVDAKRGHQLAGVNVAEIDPNLREELVSHGLAVLTADGEWLAMHRDVAWTYKCVLSSEIARRNDLTPTTDQLQAHAAGALTGEEFPDSQMLKGSGSWGNADDERRMESYIGRTVGLMSLSLVVPEHLAAVPIHKIIQVRQRFGHEFDRWRLHIDSVATDLAQQLETVESAEVVDAYLREAVRQLAAQPLNSLQRAIGSVGLDAGQEAINTRFAAPATLAALGIAAAQPQVAAAAGVAVGFIGLIQRTRRRAQATREVPNAYLLDVHEHLTPLSWVQRMGRMLRVVIGLESR